MRNFSETICNLKDKTLTAKAYKSRQLIIEKALKLYGFNSIYDKESQPLQNKIKKLINELVFEKKISLQDLRQLNKSIKIKDNNIIFDNALK